MKHRLLLLPIIALFTSGCSCSFSLFSTSSSEISGGGEGGWTTSIDTSSGTTTYSGTTNPTTSSTSGEEFIPDFTYEVVTYSSVDYAKITGINLDTSIEELTIPSTLDGYPVGAIELFLLKDFKSLKVLNTSVVATSFTTSTYFYNLFGATIATVPTSLREVTLDGVCNKRFMFKDIDTIDTINLKNIDLELTITSLSYLKHVTLDNVTILSASFLSGTPNLQDITVTNSSFITDEYGDLYDTGKTKLYRAFFPTGRTKYTSPSTLSIITSVAFQNCPHLKEIELNVGCDNVYTGAFQQCTNLEKITLATAKTSLSSMFITVPSTLTTVVVLGGTLIGASFLAYNTTVTNLTLPSTIITVGTCAFQYYKGATTIYLPNVARIDSTAFEGCTATVYTFASTAMSYGNGIFKSSSITSFTMPAGISNVGDDMFSHCVNLTNITLHNDIKTIGARAFQACTSLTSIDLRNVTSIGNNAFENCTSLTSITLPAGIKSIGEYAFSGCTSLTSVNFANASVSLDKYCFYASYNLSSLINTSNISSIGLSCFRGISDSVTTANFPKASVAHYAFCGWSYLQTLNIGRIAGTTSSTIGDLFGTSSFSNTYAAEQKKVTYYIPNSLTTLTVNLESGLNQYYAANMSSLTAINLNEGIGTVGKGAFYQCYNIDHVYLPNSITLIEQYAFSRLDNCRFVDSHYADDNAHKFRNVTVEAYAFSFKKLQWMVPPTGKSAYLTPGAVIIYSGSPKFYLGVVPQNIYHETWINPSNTYPIYASYADNHPGSGINNWWHYDSSGTPVVWS